jgi:phage shock protein A
MGILARIAMIVRSWVTSAVSRAEDPAKILEQTLLDMEHAYRRAKDQVAHSIADQKRLEKTLAEQQTEAGRWQERAVLAVEKGDDTLAKDALRRKNEHTRLAAQLGEQLKDHQENVASLKEGLRDLEARMEDLKRKKSLLISRQRQAEAQDQIYRGVEGVRSAGALETIRRMEEKVDQMVALSGARREMQEEFSGDRLERRFKTLEASGPDVEQDLLQLKQRIQIEHKRR